MSNSKPSRKSTTPAVVARVQRAVAIKHGGQVPKGSYVGRMQRIAAQQQPSKPNTPAAVARIHGAATIKIAGSVPKVNQVKNTQNPVSQIRPTNGSKKK